MDWCTLGRFDADPVLCRILDADRGGYLSVKPADLFASRRAYLPGTNVLRTVHETGGGRVAVLDFMPVGRSVEAGVRSAAPSP